MYIWITIIVYSWDIPCNYYTFTLYLHFYLYLYLTIIQLYNYLCIYIMITIINEFSLLKTEFLLMK